MKLQSSSPAFVLLLLNPFIPPRPMTEPGFRGDRCTAAGDGRVWSDHPSCCRDLAFRTLRWSAGSPLQPELVSKPATLCFLSLRCRGVLLPSTMNHEELWWSHQLCCEIYKWLVLGLQAMVQYEGALPDRLMIQSKHTSQQTAFGLL